MASSELEDFQLQTRTIFQLLRAYHRFYGTTESDDTHPLLQYILQLEEGPPPGVTLPNSLKELCPTLEPQDHSISETKFLLQNFSHHHLDAGPTAIRWFQNRYPRHHPRVIDTTIRYLAPMGWNFDLITAPRISRRRRTRSRTKPKHQPPPILDSQLTPPLKLPAMTPKPPASHPDVPIFSPPSSPRFDPSFFANTPLIWTTCMNTNPLPLTSLPPQLDSQTPADYSATNYPILTPSQESSNPDTNLDALLRVIQMEESYKFQRHEHRGNKSLNWTLSPTRPILIVGDSNLARLPLIQNLQVQVDCYPGANLAQAAHLIRYNTPISNEVQQVILSFGINDKDQNNVTLLTQRLQRLLSAASLTFPLAEIFVPLINFSRDLAPTMQRNLKHLNRVIKTSTRYVTNIPQRLFLTCRDNVHWTPSTAKTICNHWQSFLGLGLDSQTKPP